MRSVSLLVLQKTVNVTYVEDTVFCLSLFSVVKRPESVPDHYMSAVVWESGETSPAEGALFTLNTEIPVLVSACCTMACCTNHMIIKWWQCL